MLSLIFKLVRDNMTFPFMGHIFVNMGINSIIIPLYQKTSNDAIIKNDQYYGLSLVIVILIINQIAQYHHYQCLNPLKTEFRGKIQATLEEFVNEKINDCSFNKIRTLNKAGIKDIKNNTKRSMLYFIDNAIWETINMFPFIGYMGFIMYISVKIGFLYIIGLIVIIMLYPKQKKQEWSEYDIIWKRHYSLETKLFTDIIHQKGDDTMKKMIEMMNHIEKTRRDDKKLHDQYINGIIGLYTLVIIFGIMELMRSLPPTEIIILFVMYIAEIKSGIHSVSNVYSQYGDCYREYIKLEKIIKECIPREKVFQICDFNNLTLNHLNYRYSTLCGFELNLSTPLVFRRGEIIALHGKSGHGKSTFMDIITGIIPYNQYEFELYVDDNKMTKGFCSLINVRSYIEQSESINYEMSIYEIITGVQPIQAVQAVQAVQAIQALSNNNDESVVWDALLMSGCENFTSLVDGTSKKYIYQENVGLSGGEKGRIALARGLYRLMIDIHKYKIACFDEHDKCIETTLLVEISNKIYQYCKEKNVLTFIVAHSTEVKEMTYDQNIYFDEGNISLLKS